MKTEVIMNRRLLEMDIRQKSKCGYFCANDLILAGNKWRLDNNLPIFNDKAWYIQKNVVEFMDMLKDKYGNVKIASRGRAGTTWLHPLLFIDMALAISPKLKIEVYEWLYDYLLKYRNDSGDSYKKMAGSIFLSISNKSEYQKTLIETAKTIKDKLDVDSWQDANEHLLKLRDRIHENIALLCDVINVKDAVRIGISKAVRRY
jgi:hypothetical protein